MTQFTMFDRESDRDAFLRVLKQTNEAVCPCCERRARINKMRIHSTLAAMLMNLAKVSNAIAGDLTSWVHVEAFRLSYASTGNDFCICKHWNVVEARPADDDEDKNSSGQYRLTPLGRDFVMGKVSIPKYAFVFDNRVQYMSEEKVNIEQSLNNKFSYAELFTHIGIEHQLTS